jgi:dTDP-4-amino-4,6-dideoxygalactose transaminase
VVSNRTAGPGPAADPAELPFLRPSLPATAQVDAYFESSRSAGWFSNGGPCLSALTSRISDWLPEGTECALVANGTLALALAIRAAIGMPDTRREVLLPSFTFAAVPAAVIWAGFEPVFVDVDAETWQMSADSLGRALSEREENAAGVLACSTFGTMPPSGVREAWSQLSADAGLPMIVDSAAGFGSEGEGGERTGAAGVAEIFSFHATKTFAIGEGGLVSSRDSDVIARVRSLTSFGFDDERIVTAEVGLNAKMSEWSAATALAVLDEFGGILDSRRRKARTIVEAAGGLGYSAQPGSALSAWQFVPLMATSSAIRQRVLELAPERRIGVRTYFDPPLHRMPGFESVERAGSLAATEELASRALSLPMSNDMTDEEVARVVELLEESSQ